MGRLAYQLPATVGALCLIIQLTTAQTPEPEWAPTGKLNQFRGFVTPRPLPPNAEFVYASVWAAWSAWSFCSNGVRMRVRACNTVKGFNCLGPNKEYMPCDGSLLHSHRNPSSPSDYDVVDPYEADRREAMRQLYPDDFPTEEKKNPNFVKIPKSESGGFRVHAAEPIRERTPIQVSDFQRNHGDLSPGSANEGHNYGPPAPRQFAVKTAPTDKDAQEVVIKDPQEAEQFQLHREEVEAALSSLRIRDEGRTGEKSSKEQPDIRVWDPSELVEPEKKTRGSNDFSKWRNPPDVSKKSLWETKDVVEKKKSEGITLQEVHEQVVVENVTHAIEQQPEEHVTEPPTTPEPTTTLSGPIFEDDDHFEQFGTQPRIVEPKLNRNDIDDDVVPEVVIPVVTEPPPTTTQTSTEPPTTTELTTTTSSTTTSAPIITAVQFATLEESEISDALKDIIDERKLLEASNQLTFKVNKPFLGLSKVVPENAIRKQKMKGFGITGVLLRKNHLTSKKHALHEGDVTTRGTIPTTVRTTTTRRTTTSTTTRAPIIEENPQELSQDTLHALDWMLQNITKIAEQGDEAFMKALQVNSDDNPNAIGSQEAFNSEPAELVVPLATIKHLKSEKKTSKPKKTKKGRRKGVSKKRKSKKLREPVGRIHSGEFKPAHLDKKKMFPKFKSTITMAVRSRSFGVRTVNEDKEGSQWDQAAVDVPLETASQKDLEKKDSGTTEDPALLLEEIETLQSLMDDMEKRVHGVSGKNDTGKSKTGLRTPPSYLIKKSPAAMDLSLVPSNAGFLPGGNQEFHQQPMHIITEGTASVGESRWTDWGSWADCFCGKQVRTRRCIYSGAMSSGCQGNSYESRDCTGGWCPVSTEAVRPDVTTIKTPQVLPEKPSDPRRHFRPLQLHTATSLS